VSARAPDMKEKETTPAPKTLTAPQLTFQEVMLKYFPPAPPDQPSTQLTTTDIFEKLQEFYPGAYTHADVFQLLHEKYQSQSIGGMDRVWLVGNVL
jgi:hypothetical protein